MIEGPSLLNIVALKSLNFVFIVSEAPEERFHELEDLSRAQLRRPSFHQEEVGRDIVERGSCLIMFIHQVFFTIDILFFVVLIGGLVHIGLHRMGFLHFLVAILV